MKKFLMKLKSKLNWVTLVLVIITFMVAFVVGGRTGAKWAHETVANNQKQDKEYKKAYDEELAKLTDDYETDRIIENIIEDAIAIDYVEFLNDKMKGRTVFTNGEIFSLETHMFKIMTPDSEIYTFSNSSTNTDIKVGDKIKVYGTVSNKKESDICIINALKIENL